MKAKIQDMTSGSPGRLIILFAIPLMLSFVAVIPGIIGVLMMTLSLFDVSNKYLILSLIF